MLVEMYEITIFEQNKHGKQNGTPGFSLPLFFSVVFFVLPSLIVDNSHCLHRNNGNGEWKVGKGRLQRMRDTEF